MEEFVYILMYDHTCDSEIPSYMHSAYLTSEAAEKEKDRLNAIEDYVPTTREEYLVDEEATMPYEEYLEYEYKTHAQSEVFYWVSKVKLIRETPE